MAQHNATPALTHTIEAGLTIFSGAEIRVVSAGGDSAPGRAMPCHSRRPRNPMAQN